MTNSGVDYAMDPRSGEEICGVERTSPNDVEKCIVRATQAATIAADTAPAVRSLWLNRAADALIRDRDELAQIADSETALGWDRLSGEVQRTADQLRFYGSAAADGDFMDATIEDGDALGVNLARVSVPLGPIAVFGSSNFPFAFSVMGHDTGSALAAGCSVVAKAHPAHPLTSRRVYETVSTALKDAGAPDGLLELVYGYDSGNALVDHPEITAVAFTGSQFGGLALWRRANGRDIPIPVFAEMGTVNPVVVTVGAADRINQITADFVESFTQGDGQFCTKPGLLFAPRRAGAPAATAKALRNKSPEPIMLTADIAAGVKSGLKALEKSGAQLLEQRNHDGDGWAAPAAVMAVKLEDLTNDSVLLAEVFGPVALIAEYDDLDEALVVIDRMQGALAASMMIGQHDTDAARVRSHLERRVGRVIANGWPTGVAVSRAQHHGGPWPATSHPAATSVGSAALERFVRPIAFQDVPDEVLPPALQAMNPWRISRRKNGKWLDGPTDG